MKIFFSFFLSFILISCSSKKKTFAFPNANSTECILVEQNFDILNLSSDENELSNIELKSFNSSKFRYDILFHYLTEGTNSYLLERWYVDENNNWHHIQIKDNKRKVINFKCSEGEILPLFDFFDSKSYIQECTSCFGCKNYTFIIKENGRKFSYLANGNFFTDLKSNDKSKVEKYYNIFLYFKDK